MRWDIFRSSILSSIFSLHSQMRNVTPKSTVGIYTNTTRNKELDRESYISFSYIDETARKLLSFQSSRGTIASKWMLYMLLECVLFTVNLFLNPPPPFPIISPVHFHLRHPPSKSSLFFHHLFPCIPDNNVCSQYSRLFLLSHKSWKLNCAWCWWWLKKWLKRASGRSELIIFCSKFEKMVLYYNWLVNNLVAIMYYSIADASKMMMMITINQLSRVSSRECYTYFWVSSL